eukprot:scaffold5.g661.t1
MEAICGNLGVCEDLRAEVASSAYSLPGDKRAAGMESRLAAIAAHVDPLYQQVRGATMVLSTSAAAAAAREAQALPAAVGEHMKQKGVNPHNGVQLAQQFQRSCDELLAWQLDKNKTLNVLAPFRHAASTAAFSTFLQQSTLPGIRTDLCGFMQGANCSVADLLAAASSMPPAAFDLRIAAATAVGYAAISAAEELNARYRLFAKPAVPAAMLAPAVLGRTQGLLASIRQLEQVDGTLRAMGRAMSPASRGLLEVLRQLLPRALPGWAGDAEPGVTHLHAAIADANTKAAVRTAEDARRTAAAANASAALAGQRADMAGQLAALANASAQRGEAKAEAAAASAQRALGVAEAASGTAQRGVAIAEATAAGLERVAGKTELVIDRIGQQEHFTGDLHQLVLASNQRLQAVTQQLSQVKTEIRTLKRKYDEHMQPSNKRLATGQVLGAENHGGAVPAHVASGAGHQAPEIPSCPLPFPAPPPVAFWLRSSVQRIQVQPVIDLGSLVSMEPTGRELREVAKRGDTVAVQRLLVADPAAASAADEDGWLQQLGVATLQ